jgi:hypothetical protein
METRMSAQTNPSSGDVLLPRDAAKRLGLAPATLAKMRCLGGSPEFLRLGRKIVYERGALDLWVAQRRACSTSDADRLPRRLTDEMEPMA